MRSSRMLFFASWIILLVVLGAIALYSLLSLWRAYTAPNDGISEGYTLNQVRETGGEAAVKAIRGRRATASTAAVGFALLALAVVWVPYRRGERWAWWALLISIGLSQLLSLARAPMLPTTSGLGPPAIILAFALIGLLAGAPRMFAHTSDVIDEE